MEKYLIGKKKWTEEFDDIFGENHHKICIGKNCECHKVVKQFISDLRKRDMEALIGIMKDKFAPSDNFFTIYLIKDYYEK